MLKQSVGKNISSSIIVFLVALPLCLGISLASKAPEFSGIIAGVIGGIIVGLLSGSPLSVSGPAAGLSSIVAASITDLGSFDIFLVAVVIAGVVQVIFGLLKLGVIGDYIPNSVIKGMLAAIGLILILKQFQHLIGYDKDYEGDEAFLQVDADNTFSGILHAINSITPLAAVIGIISILILIIYERPFMKKQSWTTYLSGPLTVVLVGIGISYIFQTDAGVLAMDKEHFVQMPIAHSTTEFFSFFTFPNFSAISNPLVWKAGLTIGLVASIETLLGIEAVDKLDPYNRMTPTNKELIAQGVGNTISGLVGGLPLTSVIVRSSANVAAGATNKISTILHGCILLICAIAIPNILNLIPKSALAAILMFTGYKLIKPSIIKHYYKLGWDQFVPFAVTIICIVATDLLKGVLVGLAFGIFYVIRTNFRKSVISVRNDNNYLIKLQKDVFFFTKPILKNKLNEIEPNSNVIIDISNAKAIDRDIIDTLDEFKNAAVAKDIHVEFKLNPQQNYPEFRNLD
jgi:MFS superfamily sulfate permease-like transporter